jgi:hypothetical protein
MALVSAVQSLLRARLRRPRHRRRPHLFKGELLVKAGLGQQAQRVIEAAQVYQKEGASAQRVGVARRQLQNCECGHAAGARQSSSGACSAAPLPWRRSQALEIPGESRLTLIDRLQGLLALVALQLRVELGEKSL